MTVSFSERKFKPKISGYKLLAYLIHYINIKIPAYPRDKSAA